MSNDKTRSANTGTQPEQLSTSARLKKYENLITSISEQVRKKYLFPYEMPHWAWPEEQNLGRLGRRLHQMYCDTPYCTIFLFPMRLWWGVGLALSLMLEPFYPLFFPMVLWIVTSIGSISWSCRTVGMLALFVVGLLLLLLIPLLSAIGAYWSFYELVANRRLSRRLKFIVALIIVFFVGVWVSTGAPLLSTRVLDRGDVNYEELDHEGFQVSQRAYAIQQSLGYLVPSAFFFYVPTIIFWGIWVVKLVVALTVFGMSAFHWLFAFHVGYSVEIVGEFLSIPLPLNGDSSQTLLDLETTEIDTLYDWAQYRRRGMQGRLVLSTLILAFLGLLAGTSLGESAVFAVINILHQYFQPSVDSFQWLAAFYQLMLLAGLIILPLILIGWLLSEVFTMDFIVQACILARHVKESGSGGQGWYGC